MRQLTKAGCKKVFRETASGAKTDRSQLRRALDQLEAGDVLMVTRLDRLARSTRDLLIGTLLDQIDGPIAPFTADGAYDQDSVYGEVTGRHPDGAGRCLHLRSMDELPPRLAHRPDMMFSAGFRCPCTANQARPAL